MIVYAEREQQVRTRDLLTEVVSAADPIEKLIRFGQLEAGIADAVCSEVDDMPPLLRTIRQCARTGEYARLYDWCLPETVRIRPAEGFAYYAVYPDLYERAASRFVRECRPAGCVVVGIRSIGTALSTAVERALLAEGCRVSSVTVRPRGHPFDRYLKLSGDLAKTLQAHAATHHFLIVDEGPGLSGSSFASVAEKLSALGVSDGRIILFPSHEPDADAFVSQRARARWCRHGRYVEPFESGHYVPAGLEDFSGGLWRGHAGCDDIAVVPQHERRKYFDAENRVLWKWTGLGHYGRLHRERAELLADAGFGPRPLRLTNGFLISEWMEGQPVRTVDADLLDTMAQYLATLLQTSIRGAVAYTSLVEMIQVNAGIECPDRDAVIEDGAAVAVDGRMLPQEWLRTGSGWLKVDALDHHDDHFFPGCQDIAWDIAGAAVEFGFDLSELSIRYLRLQPDATLHRRLPFYRLAYAAYRLGYASMARQFVGGTPDELRFEVLEERYRAATREFAGTRPAISLA